jgi:glycosyltransferase involved in cell wall biosynthesis
LEIIAVDDGSTDGTGEVLDRLEREYDNLQVIHTENKGAFKARWKAISVASGEWIGFVDADDEIDSYMYAKLIRITMNDPEVDVAVCAIEREESGGKKYSQMKTFGNGVIDLSLTPEKMTLINPSYCNKIFRCEIAKRSISFEHRIDVMEDFLFWASICPLIRKVGFTDEPLYRYRYYEDSVTKKIGVKECIDAELGLKELIELYRQYYPNRIELLQTLSVIHFGIGFTINFNVSGDSLAKLYKETCQFLDRELPGWRNNKIYNLNTLSDFKLVKVVVSGRLYRRTFWLLFVHIYNRISKILKIDMKW